MNACLHQLPSAQNDPEWLHRQLARLNRGRLLPAFANGTWRAQVREEAALRELEGEFVEAERVALQAALADVPSEAGAFMAWFERLRDTGPGQNDALFPWLARKATLAQMRWFLSQEVAGEAGFDDLVALAQLRMPVGPKLELARNYWDEMGRGHEDGMHGPMLAATADELALEPTTPETSIVEALALANMMVALAANRRYAYQALGALGVIEMTAPGRVAQVNEGLKRLGVAARGRRYFQLHAGLDVRHSAAWNAEVIQPLVAADPATAKPIAEGALLRLTCGARCFERYRREFCLSADTALPPRRITRKARAA